MGFLEFIRMALHDQHGAVGSRWRRFGSLLLAWGMLVAVSFGMLWLGDKLNASGMALTRFMARAQAPLAAQFTYPSTTREQITVLTYDQQYLSDTGSAWPITYQAHADELLRLVQDPNVRPKAIFLDITFGQAHNDPSLPALKAALCALQNDYHVPVFLAALPSPETGALTVRAGLGDQGAPGRPACFTRVGVDNLPDPLDGLAWIYPLTRHWDGADWVPGPASDPAHQPHYRSAAMTLAQDVAGIDLGEETVPMSLMWGHNTLAQPADEQAQAMRECRVGTPSLMALIPGVLRQWWANTATVPLCPYHTTLSMAQMGQLSEAQLAPYLQGRYVLIGANVPGYNDVVFSPVHQRISGVHLHAMALDNLLTYQGQYKQSDEWDLPPPRALLGPGLLAVTAVFGVHLLWRHLAGRLQRRRRQGQVWHQRWLLRHLPARCRRTHALCRALGSSGSATLAQRACLQSCSALVWLARIAVQTTVTMGLIGLLQTYFRIGMLPVVELVSMTLIAEGLGYMSKVRWFLWGPAPNEPTHTALPHDFSPPTAVTQKGAS